MNPLTVKNINKTTIFALPLVVSDTITYRDIITKDYVNSYIADLDDAKYDGFDTLQVAFTGNKRKSFGEKEMYKYDRNEKDYSIYVFETPEVYMDDMSIYFRSQYSKLSEQAKQKILTFWDEKEDSELYAILYNKPELLTAYTPPAKDRRRNPNRVELYPEIDIGSEMLGWG